MFTNGKDIGQMKYKQIQKAGVLLLIAAFTAVCLSGCGDVRSDQAKDVADETSLKPGMQNQTPDIPYSDQIDTIVRNKEIWCFVRLDDGEDYEEEYGANESDYYYWITDMDQNGYLEVISSSTTGNGSYFYNQYFEVSQDGKSLIKLKTDEWEDAPAADLWLVGEYSQGYYDVKTGTYHYPQIDHTHGSASDTSDAQLDVVLSDGEVVINTIFLVESEDYDKQSEKQLEKLYEQYYEGMQEFTVTSHRFCNIDENDYKKSKITVVSDEILRERAEESWDRFGIHVPSEKVPDNPFFPETAANDPEVRYLLDLMSEGKATMQIQEELRGSDSALYLVTYCDPREVSNREFEHRSEDLKKKQEKWVKKQLKDFYFYLWVTDTQIYYIPRFYSDEEVLVEDDHQKVRLVFYHEIPEYACLVCQEEELGDALEEMVEGEHQWIEKHGEDIRCYRSYTSRGEGYDTANILQFIWKRGEGLIGIRYAAHPAGGNSQIFWKEAYLEVKEGDVTLSFKDKKYH